MILAAGLSPAWQRILVFDRLETGEVNRARESYECASGKVLNVGLALTMLRANAITLSVIGGATGQRIRWELQSFGVSARWVEDPAITRTCTTLIEPATGQITELVENASPIDALSWEAFRAAFIEESARADWVMLSGSLPPIEGRPAALTVYDELMANCRGRVLLDARGAELWAGLACHPFLVKPNREELAATVGRPLPDEAALRSAMLELIERGAEWVLVTDGPGAVWLASAREWWRFTPETIRVVNPIGCGDCLAAGLVAGLDEGLSCPEAVCRGIAAAAQNAQSMLPARLDYVLVQESANRVTRVRLD